MSQRRDVLDRMRTSYECAESWDGMAGGDRCRFCSDCRREVFDFARMSPREVRGRLEAGRGQLCARLTREGGRVVMLAPPPRASPPRSSGRLSPLAATLLGAWLGVGSAAAQPASPPRLEASTVVADPGGGEKRPASPEKIPGHDGVLTGRVKDEEGRPIAGATVTLRQVLDGRQRSAVTGAQGAFRFELLSAGIYDLQASLAGFEIDPTFHLVIEAGRTREADLRASVAPSVVTLGITYVPESKLRLLFDDSDLVVAAAVEASELIAIEDEMAEIHTRLRIERRFKGDFSRKTVIYRHAEYLGGENRRAGTRAGGFEPGDQLVAFLTGSEDGNEIFETVDFTRGLRNPEGAERAAYLETLEALADLPRSPKTGAVRDPADLMAWLVATAVNPHTRGEAITEIEMALGAFRDLADQEGRQSAELASVLRQALEESADADGAEDERLRPIFLGAAFTERHQRQLTAALLATETLTAADRALLRLVEGWDREAARGWLVEILRGAEVENAGQTYRWLVGLAKDLGSGKTFTDSAIERWDALEDRPEDDSDEAQARFERERKTLVRELMAGLAALLANEAS